MIEKIWESFLGIDGRVVVSLISVAFGWCLAQLTTFLKDCLLARKLKSGLLEELEDIESQLRDTLTNYFYKLRVFATGGIDSGVVHPISDLFFKQYFRDTFSRLSRPQRMSYQLIHAKLDFINREIENIAGVVAEADKDLRKNSDAQQFSSHLELWGERVSMVFRTAQELRWHIGKHLTFPDHPSTYFIGDELEKYNTFMLQVVTEVRKILANAETYKREDFERFYDKTDPYQRSTRRHL